MLTCWSLNRKLLLCVALIAVIVVILTLSATSGVYAYRDVVRNVSQRAAELPYAHKFTNAVNDLAATFRVPPENGTADHAVTRPLGSQDKLFQRTQFHLNLDATRQALQEYRRQLQQVEPGQGINDNREEMLAMVRIDASLAAIEELDEDGDWIFHQLDVDCLRAELDTLQSIAAELPQYLQRRMQQLKGDLRLRYRTLIGVTWTASIASLALLIWLAKFFYDSIVSPLRVVLAGSRRVASGDFNFRVVLPSRDELGELAAALNAMTRRFQEVRDDLDRQVRERTREVVRSEQLASVGFLAAGVAHEINNPLQAIALCAESLEGRLADIITADDAKPDDEHNHEITVLRTYLRRIQDEAFRCKGITEKLLSYSRLGDAERQETDLTAIVADVVELQRTLGASRGKRIEFQAPGPQIARVVPHEIKQVVLNLLSNALDSIDPSGLVTVRIRREPPHVVLEVQDNGCGMSDEVRKHLFEPFFTRRRDGQGTGLGLSITYRIVQDHGGAIVATSDGPGHGSLFRITLPLPEYEERREISAAA